MVATIKGNDGSKSGELAEALSGAKKIVVCTIQTFPFALEAVRKLAAAQGKRFAVIADEAHSSQTGEAAAKLKAVLSPEELKELNDGGEVSTEDILVAQMSARAKDGGITFVAFTATPKNKTMEIFGTRPDPSRKPANDNVPTPFHVYSMRQAIEEKFILDVLRINTIANAIERCTRFSLAILSRVWKSFVRRPIPTLISKGRKRQVMPPASDPQARFILRARNRWTSRARRRGPHLEPEKNERRIGV